LALTSLRDLYAAGVAPEAAGGDFAPEAQALGTMVARMHLALDRAFGHELDATGRVAMRTHGDFHLGRVARTDLGWVVTDFAPGGVPPGASAPVARSPVADVADLFGSWRALADTAALERDPSGRSGVGDAGRAWDERNRSAFLSGYLVVPGIEALVPPDRSLLTATLDEQLAGLPDRPG